MYRKTPCDMAVIFWVAMFISKIDCPIKIGGLIMLNRQSYLYVNSTFGLLFYRYYTERLTI